MEGSWVDFGASRPRFWSLQASILEPPASILKPPGSIVEPPGLQPSFAYASHIQQHHLANVGQSLAWGSFLLCFGLPQQPCQSVGGGGVPPWGPSLIGFCPLHHIIISSYDSYHHVIISSYHRNFIPSFSRKNCKSALSKKSTEISKIVFESHHQGT